MSGPGPDRGLSRHDVVVDGSARRARACALCRSRSDAPCPDGARSVDRERGEALGGLRAAETGPAACAVCSCEMVAGADSLPDSGLTFEVGYFTGRKPGSSPPAWNGLYATGTTNAAESVAHRTLTVGGWHKGFEYTFAGQDAWVEVTRGAQGQFAGSFAMQWWSGDFDAQFCAKERPPEDESEDVE